MAFQQPQQRPQPSRHTSIPQQHIEIPQASASARERGVEESQEWILFTPQDNLQSVSGTSQTPRTATHLSEFGSLETHIRSQLRSDSQDEDLTCQGSDDEDGAELDSLDDGLHAFNHAFSPSSDRLDQSGGAVLPTHDGFGTFPSSSSALQDQLWQFERHNPHRKSKHVRRRSSVQRRLDALEEEDALGPDDERTARIERWRLDQSRAVLEEIERDTRRRRRRLSRMGSATSGLDRRQSVHDALASRVLTRQASAFHDEAEARTPEEQAPSESFWRRITRKVIRDLIGLDDNTLSVIFGEQLVEEATPTLTQPSPIAAAAQQESRVAFKDSAPTWEIKLLDRIARELGILVHQLSEYDGSAFNTYKQAQSQHIEYAGLPRNLPRPTSLRQRRRAEKARAEDGQAEALFVPTVPQTPLSTEQPDTSLWGIEEEPVGDEDENLREEREYWEREVDVKMVFSYLKARFARGAGEKPAEETKEDGILPASWATTTGASALSTSPEGLRRAEIIKRQHPLVSRAAERAAERAKESAAVTRRRESLLRRHQMQTLMLKRPGSSSCASQSTKRSRHTRSGSSRPYWDLGGHSVGSVGSGHAMSSGLGGWGEV